MSQSLSNVLLHIVFSTKSRQPFLRDGKIRAELFAYMAATLKELDCPALLINGVADHIHILNSLSRNITIAKLIEKIKSSSSKWIKDRGSKLRSFYWQGGYGAFSVSESKKRDVLRYIENQEQHHAQRTFQDEFRALCKRHGIQIDERYVWD